MTFGKLCCLRSSSAEARQKTALCAAEPLLCPRPIGGPCTHCLALVHNRSMKLLALVFATAVAPMCLAQYEAFPDVPENHWVYQTLYKIEQAGIVKFQYGVIRNGRPADCMEIALMAFDAYDGLLTLIEKAEWTKGRKATSWRGEVDEIAFRLQALEKETASLAAIVTAFEKELKLRRVDAKQLNADLLGIPKRIKQLLDV